MVLEQLLAFLDERAQPTGPTIELGQDHFMMLETNELKAEHEELCEVIEKSARLPRVLDGSKPSVSALDKILAAGAEQRTRYYLAMLERVFAYETKSVAWTDETSAMNNFFVYGKAVSIVLTGLYTAGVDFDSTTLPTLRWAAAHRNLRYMASLLERLLKQLNAKYNTQSLPPEYRETLVDIRTMLVDGWYELKYLVEWTDKLLGTGLWQEFFPGEFWIDRLTSDLESMPEDERSKWLSLLRHCKTASTAKPSTKWTSTAKQLLAKLDIESVSKRLMEVFSLVDKGRRRPMIASGYEISDDRQRIHDGNSDLLRGLVWLCMEFPNRDVCRAVSKVTISAYRKIRGVGPRAVKIGNAGVFVLGEMASEDAVGQLAILKVRVKFGTAQKGIEKALTTTAQRVGIPRAELEEMSVPAYGLTEVGIRRDEIGEFTAELIVEGSDAALHWFNSDGKQLKSAPSAVTKTKELAEEAKELKQAQADIDKMIPAQAARIEQTYLQQKKWNYSIWQQRYLDHPLVGTLARRLIWNFEDPGKSVVSAIFYDGQFTTCGGQIVDGFAENCQVALWHPLDRNIEEISAWRDWLVQHRVQQPFKQAHREIYILTDAERNTQTYSNRFAAHVLKQHQFNALCGARGWKNKLRLMVDDTYPPAHIELPVWQLRAEFWIEAIGSDYGVDANESGTYYYLSTDQVRFYNQQAAVNEAHAGGGGYIGRGTDRQENHPLPLTEIPAIVFSEVMRDVDLFVGVAGVGNDPAWSDGGPGGRYRDYWQNVSFGELGATSQIRKSVLERLVPMLKIGNRCSFSERFLIVRGDIRTYKIHLGSGNILMEPTDQYLCIVAKQSPVDVRENVFLPFEGDGVMSIILSKAFLLADDTKIKDSTITSQIGKGAPVPS